MFLNANTGQVNLVASTPGTYTITNSIPTSGSCVAASASATVAIVASPVAIATPSAQSICSCSATSIALTSTTAGTTYSWTVAQTNVSGASADSISTIAQTLCNTGSSAGTATYTITPNAHGCIGAPITVGVTTKTLPYPDTTSMSILSAKCGTLTGSIVGITTPSGQGSYTYQWKDSAGNVVGTGSADLSNVVHGKYTLKVTDSAGCSYIMGPYTIHFSAGVIAAFTANPTTGLNPLTVNLTNNSVGAIKYLWQFGISDTSTQINPSYTINPSGQFKICLIAYSPFACIDTACSNIDVGQNTIFMVPNIFTPNGDNINDIFSLNGAGLRTLDAEIYTRWGEKEYEWHTTMGGWDGRTASGLLAPSGTYFFIIKATGLDGKEYFEKGSFSLIRESK